MSRELRPSPTRRSLGRLLGTTALAGMALQPHSASAATDNWMGLASSNWYTAINWSPAVPTGADTVNIATSLNPALVDGGAAATGSLRIGAGGGAGTVAIQNAGVLTSNSGTLSWDPNSPGTMTVSGAGSRWNVTNLLSVGYAATSTMTVSGGGVVSDNTGFIGDTATGNGTVTVTGAGSQWGSFDLEIGRYGIGKLVVSSGGLVSSLNSTVGGHSGSTGDVTVSGAGSSWHNASSLIVGGAGTGTVTVNAGAHVGNDLGTIIGDYGTGTVTVTGSGSQMGGATLLVGNFGHGTLNVLAGGVVADGGGTIGSNVLSQGAVTVDGAGSSWTTGALTVGSAGAGSLTVSNGGQVSSGITVLADQSGSAGTAVVTGAGSTWTVSDIYVGHLGDASLTIANGGVVSASGLVVVGAGALGIPGIGALNIGAAAGSAAAAPGSLNATSVGLGVGGTLNFNHTAANYVFSASIYGGGAVNQLSGNTNLTGANTYTGATTVDGGTLSVNGSIASSSMTTVNAGGTLGGNGIVGNTTINGGSLAPGNSIGTLTVQGNLVFTAAASYMVEVSPASADRTNVSGTATLGGATVHASFAAGSYIAKQYTILNASGGVSGTFGALANTNLPAGFRSSLSYDAHDVYLNLDLVFATSNGPQAGLNVNRQNIANSLMGYFNTNGGIQAVFGALSPAGLTQVSGETATGAQQTTFTAMNLFMGLLSNPFIGTRDDAGTPSAGAPQFADDATMTPGTGPLAKPERDAYAAVYRKAPADAFTQRWSVWAAGYGGSQTTDGNATAGSNTATSRVYGMAVGADYRLSPFTLAGFALAGGGTNFSVNGQGSGRSDLFQAGAFVRHTVGPAYISAAIAYGWQDVTTDRTVAIAIAGVDQLRARFNANAFSGRIEGGYRFATPWVSITPYASAQVTAFELPTYAEQVVSGADTFALGYASKNVTASRSELGLRTDKSWALTDAILTLRGRAAWAHNFNADRSVAATLQTLPGASFVVNGAAQSHDAALSTASAEVKWLNGFSLAATFEGEFSTVTRSYAGKGVARYQW